MCPERCHTVGWTVFALSMTLADPPVAAAGQCVRIPVLDFVQRSFSASSSLSSTAASLHGLGRPATSVSGIHQHPELPPRSLFFTPFSTAAIKDASHSSLPPPSRPVVVAWSLLVRGLQSQGVFQGPHGYQPTAPLRCTQRKRSRRARMACFPISSVFSFLLQDHPDLASMNIAGSNESKYLLVLGFAGNKRQKRRLATSLVR